MSNNTIRLWGNYKGTFKISGNHILLKYHKNKTADYYEILQLDEKNLRLKSSLTGNEYLYEKIRLKLIDHETTSSNETINVYQIVR